MRAALAIAAALGLAACSSKQPDPTPAPAPPAQTAQPAPAPPTPVPLPPQPTPPPAAAVTDTLPADFPPECRDYAALIDRVKACDKLGGARDGLQQGYISLRQSWSQLTPDARAAMGGQCKTQADSIRNAAAATCSW